MSVAKPKLAYSIKEAAEACGVSVDTIRRAITANDLIARYPTSRPVVDADELRAWLASKPTERAS